MKRDHELLRSRVRALLAASTVVGLMAAPMASNGAIHEIVAAYCSGGGVGKIGANGFLEPPGISDPTKHNFAQPVLSNGAVNLLNADPLLVVIGSSRAAKYPEGTTVVDLATFTFLSVSQASHPSTTCKNFSAF